MDLPARSLNSCFIYRVNSDLKPAEFSSFSQVPGALIIDRITVFDSFHFNRLILFLRKDFVVI
jgi:hypothetical protein